MNVRTLSLLAAASSALFSLGCQNKMYKENVDLHRENRELRDALADRDSRLGNSPDPASVQQMQSALAERDAKIVELQNQLRMPPPEAAKETNGDFGGIQVTRDDRAGTLTVNLPGDVLFTPGSADVKESAKGTLDKIANAVKKDYAGKKINVDGYTDADPITKTKGNWEDNLDLSAARARSVAKYLDSHGMDAKKLASLYAEDAKMITPRAFGPSNLKSSKDASRRVEIVVMTKS